MTTPQIHLIDGNSIGFACHNATKLHAGGRQTQAVFGIARTLHELCQRYPGSKKFVLWDGRSHWRYELFPGYKARRVGTPEQLRMRAEYKAQRADIERLLMCLGVEQVRSPVCEADDLAAAYAFVFSDKGWRTEMITSDTDWWQMVSPSVRWVDPIHDKRLEYEKFEETTGWKNARQMLDAKALAGDPSDNIPGVGAIGKANAKKMLERFGRVPTFLKMYDEDKHSVGDIPKPWIQFAENFEGRRERYHRNVKLMELKPGLPGVDKRVTTKGKFDPDGLRRLFEELAFHTLIARFDSWIVPFERHV